MSSGDDPERGRTRHVEEASGSRATLVTGATGLVGAYLLPLLLERRYQVQAISRRPRGGAAAASVDEGSGSGREIGLGAEAAVESRAGLTRRVVDLERPPVSRGMGAPSDRTPPHAESEDEPSDPALGPATTLLHAAPIWLLPAWLPAFAELGVLRLVAFSSTSRFTKRESSSLPERETARRLVGAEVAVEEVARARGIHWTILRPTLVYGGGRDRNVSDIARFVAHWGFFPVAGDGRGLRQPVHAADLARAAVSILDSPATFDRAYDLPGGETLAYTEMVARIARGLGREPRLLHVPVPLLRAAAGVASHLPRWRHLTPAMADRMNEDLVFDAARARRDFGYDPRPFAFPDADSLLR